jgi:hypothetical protein
MQESIELVYSIYVWILSCVGVTMDGVRLVNGIIYHLHTQLGTTSNYSATTKLQNSQITTAHTKLFPAYCVFTSLSPAMASNSGDSSALSAQVLSSQIPIQNSV